MTTRQQSRTKVAFKAYLAQLIVLVLSLVLLLLLLLCWLRLQADDTAAACTIGQSDGRQGVRIVAHKDTVRLGEDVTLPRIIVLGPRRHLTAAAKTLDPVADARIEEARLGQCSWILLQARVPRILVRYDAILDVGIPSV